MDIRQVESILASTFGIKQPSEIDLEQLRRDLEAAIRRKRLLDAADDETAWRERQSRLSAVAQSAARMIGLLERDDVGFWVQRRLTPLTLPVSASENTSTEAASEPEKFGAPQILALFKQLRSAADKEASRLDTPITDKIAPGWSPIPPMQLFISEYLAKLYDRYFASGSRSRSDTAPFPRFVHAFFIEAQIITSTGKPYSLQSIQSSIRDFQQQRGRRRDVGEIGT